jgi:hypothetical protein
LGHQLIQIREMLGVHLAFYQNRIHSSGNRWFEYIIFVSYLIRVMHQEISEILGIIERQMQRT